jgi:hypothetical protein
VPNPRETALSSFEVVGPASAGALLRRYRGAQKPLGRERCDHCGVLVRGAHSCPEGVEAASGRVVPIKRRKRV